MEKPKVGKGTKIWKPSNIYGDVEIGDNCSIGAFCEIGGSELDGKSWAVIIRNNVRIGAHSFIPGGVTIADNAWIGPGVTFTNDKHPPSYGKHWKHTLVQYGAVIGARAVILPGVTIGVAAKVGAGAVVTKDVPDGVTVCGNPAQIHNKK